MNDERNGMLVVNGYYIPRYAQSSLYLESESGTVATEGPSGLFTLPAPSQRLVLRWGHAEGPALASLRWMSDSLGWDGTVSIGGYVDALHVLTLDEEEGEFVAVIHVGGQPLMPNNTLYPRASQRKQPYERPDFDRWIDESVAESHTTWLLSEDNPLLTLAQDAMLNKLRVVFTGRLVDEDTVWDKLLALPLTLEAITLSAP